MERYQLENLERDAILYTKEIERMKKHEELGALMQHLRVYLEEAKAKMAEHGFKPDMSREVYTTPWGNEKPAAPVVTVTSEVPTPPQEEKRTAKNQDWCRSCGQKITWLKTAKGKAIPINAWQRIPGGLWGKELGTHWETCPHAKEWKGAKRK